MHIELKAAPLVMLIKYPDIINTRCPVGASLQASTFASLNFFRMLKVHVAKNQLPVGNVHTSMSCCGNVAKKKRTLEQ
jgi:hypothetical protein